MTGFCSSWALPSFGLNSFTLLVFYLLQFCYFLYVVLGTLCTGSIYLNLSKTPKSGSQGLHDWTLACLAGLAQFPIPNLQIKTYSLPRDYPALSHSQSSFLCLEAFILRKILTLQQEELPWLPFTWDLLHVLSNFHSLYLLDSATYYLPTSPCVRFCFLENPNCTIKNRQNTFTRMISF